MRRLLYRRIIFSIVFTITNILFGGIVLGQTTITNLNTGYASNIPANTDITINAGGTLIMDVSKTFSSITATNTGVSIINGPGTLTVTATSTNSGNGGGKGANNNEGSIIINDGSTLEINTTASTDKLVANEVAKVDGTGSLTVAASIDMNGKNKSTSAFTIGSAITVITKDIYADRGTGNTLYNLSIEGILRISGVLEGGFSHTNNSAYTNIITCAAGSTVEYNGADQTVFPTAYYNLILSGSDVKTITGLSTINGDFTMKGTTSALSTQGINIEGDVLLENSATFGAGSYYHTVGGHWTNNGTFNKGTSTVTFDGSSLQEIKGGDSTSFYSLAINNAAGVLLGQNVKVNDTLKLVNGQVMTSSASLLTLNDNAKAIGASNASFVNGPTQKVGNDAFVFPVGRDGKYVPIAISASGDVNNAFIAAYFPSSATALGTITSPGLINVSGCEYWDLNRTGGGANVNVTLFWDEDNACSGPGYISDPTSIVVAHNNGISWNTHGGSGIGYATRGSVTWNPVLSLSSRVTFGTTSADNVLPVHFYNVRATEKSSGVQVEFTNLTESDVAYYDVERSSDGNNYSAVKKIYPSKNNYGSAVYNWLDGTAKVGRNIYRIKAVETGGKIVYSGLVSISLGAQNTVLRVYAKGRQVMLQVNSLPEGKYQLLLFNAAGQLFSLENIDHAGGAFSETIPSRNVKAGIYILNISGAVHLQKKFLVQ